MLRFNKMVMAGLCLVILAASSCGYAPAGLAPSTTPVDIDDMTVLGHATGQMSYFSLLGLFPFGKTDYDAAIADAISKFEGGRALINVRATQKATYYIVGVQIKLTVEGDVIR